MEWEFLFDICHIDGAKWGQLYCDGAGWYRVNSFTAAGKGLCFGFVLYWYYRASLAVDEQCLHRVKTFSAPYSTTPVSRIEVHKKLEEDTARDNWPQLTKGIFQTVLQHAQHIKMGEEGRGGMGQCESLHLSSQLTFTHGRALLSWWWLNIACWYEVMNEFLALLCLHTGFLLYLMDCLCLNPLISSLLVCIFSPHPTRREEGNRCVELRCWLELNHSMCKWE